MISLKLMSRFCLTGQVQGERSEEEKLGEAATQKLLLEEEAELQKVGVMSCKHLHGGE